MSFLVTIASFLVTVGVLVVIHELGHYAAARMMDVKILRFSVGFGRAIRVWKRGRDQTEWAIAAVPLGGYVKMLDEREGEVRREEAHRAFNRKSVWARIFIVLAGPIANLVLAVLVYWALFIAGMPGVKPVLGAPVAQSAAAAAGLADGDLVRAIDGERVATWNDVRWLLLQDAVKRGTARIDVEAAGGALATRRVDLSGLTKEDLDRDFLAKLGLRPFRPDVPARLGRILPGSAAERAGLREGDVVLSVGAKPVRTWFDFTALVTASPAQPIAIEVRRDGRVATIHAVPDAVGEGEARIGRLGVEASPELKKAYERLATTVRYDPLNAFGKAVQKVVDLSSFSLKMLGRMAIGQVSWRNLSGPITIADYAGQSAQLGWIAWLGFLALVSVSLGVLNLLPIPLLDGGHLVYYLAEIVKGSPVSDRAMEIGQRFGLALLVGLTVFAFYNDINRLFTG
ncbi:MAG TPA: RIP metalloprotease RseP [Usitatibacter sp.]|jgi:regulator of sigma E protease|nr:RIP metalloprotease RseP [Usitatibacter sp.]